MVWIESHVELEGHPKLYKLRKLTSLPADTLIGRLHQLWWWTAKYAFDGDLSKHDPAMIEEYTTLSLEMLIEAKFIDAEPYLRIHDWWDRIQHFAKLRYKNRPQEWIRIRNLYKGTSKGASKGASKSVNQTNLTKPTIINTFDFELVWNKYPKRIGKKLAERLFISSVVSEKDFTDIQAALANYLQSSRVKNGYIQNGSTWFNNWKDWIDYQEVSNVTSPTASRGYIGTQAPVGKYAQIPTNVPHPRPDKDVPGREGVSGGRSEPSDVVHMPQVPSRVEQSNS